LNCPNGTIDLRTGGLRPHRREDYVTKLCPTRYDPAATCPAWDRFLGSIFTGDEELIGFIRRLLGYCLTGDTREHVLAVFYGHGGNGKSTFVEVSMGTLGPDYAGKVDQDLLLAKRGESHPTGKADLRGKRLMVANETADGRRLDEATVKELTGGDTVKARFMKQDFFQFAPTHKLVICSNYKPAVRGTDAGIWRRIRLVPFTARFWSPDEPGQPGEDRPDHLRADKGMKDRLLAEREGILAWMVRGTREWLAAGDLGTPAAVAAATVEYRQEEDMFGRFLQERCERDGLFRVRSSVLYAAFKTWCAVNGVDDPRPCRCSARR
jgi:putative DNA primase/helicase